MGGTEGGEVTCDIVIVGAGICGLATALALHRFLCTPSVPFT